MRKIATAVFAILACVAPVAVEAQEAPVCYTDPAIINPYTGQAMTFCLNGNTVDERNRVVKAGVEATHEAGGGDAAGADSGGTSAGDSGPNGDGPGCPR